MKITNITLQVRDRNRANISVDGVYRFSLDVFQVGELGLKLGKEYSEAALVELETESQFGKLYARALEYCLMRPHSSREIRDYLWRKTRTTKIRNKKTGEIKERLGVSQAVVDRVYDRLLEKKYVDDERFARWWIDNRNQTKGSSLRKLSGELRLKGIESSTIDAILSESNRSDDDEIRKVIAKKAKRYSDSEKLMRYLASQGFAYDDIKRALGQDTTY